MASSILTASNEEKVPPNVVGSVALASVPRLSQFV